MVTVGRAAHGVAALVFLPIERGIVMFDQVKTAVKTAAARVAALLGIIEQSKATVERAVEVFDENVTVLRGRVEHEAHATLDKLHQLNDAIDESVAAFDGIGETEDLTKLTVPQLRERVDALGYETKGLRKAELIELLS